MSRDDAKRQREDTKLKANISDNHEHEGFTVSLALVDALPVLFFGVAAVALGVKLRSPLFFLGAIVCLLAGTGKVLWKLLIALRGRDVALLGAQLRYLMPSGFALMLIGAAQLGAMLGVLLL